MAALIGFRNRAIVLLNWAWNYLRKDRPIRMITSIERDPLADELTASEAVTASPSPRWAARLEAISPATTENGKQPPVAGAAPGGPASWDWAAQADAVAPTRSAEVAPTLSCP
jgi:hypothetical protein